MKRFLSRISYITLAILTAAPSLAADGFELIGNAPRQKALDAADLADSKDATSMSFNPAGIIGLERGFQIGVTAVLPERGYNAQGAPFVVAPGDVGSGRPIFPSPNGAYVQPIDAESASGVVSYGAGGINTAYDAGHIKPPIYSQTPFGPVLVALPFRRRADHHRKQQRNHHRDEGAGVVWRTDGDFIAADHVDDERIKGSQKNREGGGAEQNIVQRQSALAADGRERNARLEVGSAKRIQRQRAARGDEPRRRSLFRKSRSARALQWLSPPTLPSHKGPPPAYIPPPPLMTWNGVYIGANGGWGWSDYNFAQVPFGATAVGEITPLPLRTNADGPLFGGEIGYNWQFHPNWVAGIEGDFDGASIHSSSTAIVPSRFVPALSNNIFSAEEKLQWLASIRGRLGYSLAPGFVVGPMLIYATGGAAWANFSGSALMNAEVAPAVFGQSTFGNVNYTRSGAVVGGGIEWMFAPNWSLKAEYLHYFLSGASTSALPFLNCAIAGCGIAVEHRNSDIDSVRLGLNYQIKWNPVAVVAKY